MILSPIGMTVYMIVLACTYDAPAPAPACIHHVHCTQYVTSNKYVLVDKVHNAVFLSPTSDIQPKAPSQSA